MHVGFIYNIATEELLRERPEMTLRDSDAIETDPGSHRRPRSRGPSGDRSERRPASCLPRLTQAKLRHRVQHRDRRLRRIAPDACPRHAGIPAYPAHRPRRAGRSAVPPQAAAKNGADGERRSQPRRSRCFVRPTSRSTRTYAIPLIVQAAV